MTERQLYALGVLGSGLLGVGIMTLFATGRTKEAYALTGSVTLVGAVLAAGRVLSGQDEPPGMHHAQLPAPGTP